MDGLFPLAGGAWGAVTAGGGHTHALDVTFLPYNSVTYPPGHVTATFDLVFISKLLPATTPFVRIQDVYDNAASGDIILAQDYFFQESQGLTLGAVSAKTITIIRGYDTIYSFSPGMTSVQGPVNIKSGELTVERLIIR